MVFKLSNKFIYLALFSLVEIAVSECPPFTICTNRRDKIIQNEIKTINKGNPKTSGRSWIIKMETTGNVLLYFKEFNSRGNSLAAFAYKDKKLIDARIFLENKNNFQVLLEDCDLLVLYVPFFENPLPTFELDYLWGCEVIKNDKYLINFESRNKMSAKNANWKKYGCWFIEPNKEIGAFYLSVHHVQISKQQSLKVWDLATKMVLLQIDGSVDVYGLVGIECNKSSSLILELSCTKVDRCFVDDNISFTLKYNIIPETDMTCLQNLECPDNQECDIPCSTFDKLISDQYKIEKKSTSVRSGSTNQKNKSKCPLPSKYCSCPAKVNRTNFCSPKIHCKSASFVQTECLWACIFAKIKICPRLMKVFRKHVKLL